MVSTMKSNFFKVLLRSLGIDFDAFVFCETSIATSSVSFYQWLLYGEIAKSCDCWISHIFVVPREAFKFRLVGTLNSELYYQFQKSSKNFFSDVRGYRTMLASRELRHRYTPLLLQWNFFTLEILFPKVKYFYRTCPSNIHNYKPAHHH